MEKLLLKISIYPLFCALLIFLDRVESSDLNYPCKTCDYVKDPCPSLPLKCEKARRTCGCCDECAGKFGEPCSARTVRCSTGLLCVNDKGEALETIPWFISRFQGTCQSVLVFPEVDENTEVHERRHVP